MPKTSAVKKGANIIPLPQINGNGTDTNGTDALSILNEMQGTKTTTSKSKVPIINDPALVKTVDEAIEVKHKMADLEAKFELLSSTLSQRIWKEYEKVKGAQGTFKLQGKTGTVSVGYTNRFKAIPIETKEELISGCGEDFDKYFSEVYEIGLLDTSVSAIQELINVIGADMFKKLFEIKKSYIKVSPNMNTLQFGCPVKGYVEQYKPSVKVA